jgi:hypothetical protein
MTQRTRSPQLTQGSDVSDANAAMNQRKRNFEWRTREPIMGNRSVKLLSPGGAARAGVGEECRASNFALGSSRSSFYEGVSAKVPAGTGVVK